VIEFAIYKVEESEATQMAVGVSIKTKNKLSQG